MVYVFPLLAHNCYPLSCSPFSDAFQPAYQLLVALQVRGEAIDFAHQNSLGVSLVSAYVAEMHPSDIECECPDHLLKEKVLRKVVETVGAVARGKEWFNQQIMPEARARGGTGGISDCDPALDSARDATASG
jgi:hypothetical protein